MLAAEYCVIISPEFNPWFGVKKGGNALCPEINKKILRSEILANSAIAIHKKSKAKAKGWP